MKLRDDTPRTWDKESRSIRIFFDWLTMRDMRYVFLITGGGLSLIMLIGVLIK